MPFPTREMSQQRPSFRPAIRGASALAGSLPRPFNSGPSRFALPIPAGKCPRNAPLPPPPLAARPALTAHRFARPTPDQPLRPAPAKSAPTRCPQSQRQGGCSFRSNRVGVSPPSDALSAFSAAHACERNSHTVVLYLRKRPVSVTVCVLSAGKNFPRARATAFCGKSVLPYAAPPNLRIYFFKRLVQQEARLLVIPLGLLDRVKRDCTKLRPWPPHFVEIQ